MGFVRSNRLLAMAIVIPLVAGCAKLRLKEPVVVPGIQVPNPPSETILPDTVLIAMDASGSMDRPAKFGYAKDLARSFVEAMPDGTYESGLVSFGGEWTTDWVYYEPQVFDRPELREVTESVELIRGETPLARMLQETTPLAASKRGHMALVLFSDGNAEPDPVLDSLAEMARQHLGPLCVYTVHFGDLNEGDVLLRRMTEITGCGSFRSADAVASAEGMAAFVREVFFGVGEMDSDGDGVVDSLDQCPGTPRGVPVDDRGCWVLEGVFFDTDRADIKPVYSDVLDNAAAVIKNLPGVSFSVDGHTDSRASDAYNLDLSQRRAEAVRQALVARGVPTGQLIASGFGESRPAVPNTSAANMARNRRVEISVID